MIVGKNVRYLSDDQKPLCSHSTNNCKQSQLHSEAFSQRQVLHKWTAPFEQCLSMSNTQKLGTAPVPRDAAFSNNHTQLVGLRNSNVEDQRQPQRGAFGGGKQDDPVSCHVTTGDHHLSLEARLKSKFNTIHRRVMAMKPDKDVGDDDPYAFTDVDVKPADTKPTANVVGASVVPSVASIVNNCHWNDLLVKMATRVPGTPLSAPSGPTAIAKLYPELAEKLEHVRSSKSDSKVTKGSLNKSSRTMNRLQTKIAQNKLKDRLKRNKNRDRTIVSRNLPQSIPSVISPMPFSSLLASMERTVSAGVPTNLLLNRTSGDSAMITTEHAACPTVANQLLCGQLTSHVIPQSTDVTASGDMLRHHEIVPVVPNTGSSDTSERCRDSTPVGARKKKCVPNKRKSDTKLIGSQRRNHSAAWKKKLGTSDVSLDNSLQGDVPVMPLPRQQLPLVMPLLPRPQLPIQNLSLPSYVPSVGMDVTQTPPQPSQPLAAPGQFQQQTPLMFPALISSLPPSLHPPVVAEFSPVTPAPLEVPLTYTCIRQRRCHQSDECCKQVKGRLRDSNALDLYMQHTECQRRSDHVLPVGVDSSDEDSESNSDLEELPWQREWVVTSSDDDNEDDDLDYGIPSAIRHTKVSLLRSKLRRQFLQLRRCRRGNAALHGTHNKELHTFLLAARRGPASTASALLEIRRVPGASQAKLKPRMKRAPLRRCLQKEEDDDKTCGQIALPYANHCLKHIMYNVDQQMFGYCTAKFSDNTQCCVPVFDVKHELPLCPEHAAKADNYQKNQGVKPKKPRKKTKPSALTRPPKKGKKKKNQKKHSHPQKPSPPSEPPVSEPSADLQNSFTVDVEGSSPSGFQSDDLEKDVDETLEDSALDPDISDELGQSFSPGVIDKNLVLPLDSEQATRFLDEALDIFSGKNGEFLPSREEAEALEQALAVASEDIYAASESIEQMSQDSAVTMSMLTADSGNEDELTKQIANSLMSPDLSSPNGSIGDDLASDNLSALANSISVADLKSLSQALTTSDLNSALDETPCGVPVVTTPYTVHTPENKPAPLSNTMAASAHMRRPPPLAPPGVLTPMENQGPIFLPIMSTALQQSASVAPLSVAPFFIEHPSHHVVPPVYPVMPFPCGMMAMHHPDTGGAPNLPQNGMVWSSLGGMERTAMPVVYQNGLPPMTAAFVSADSLQGQQTHAGPKLTYPVQAAMPPGMVPGPSRTTLASVAMARFSASQFTMAPPGGTQTLPAMAQPQPLSRHSPQQQLYPNT